MAGNDRIPNGFTRRRLISTAARGGAGAVAGGVAAEMLMAQAAEAAAANPPNLPNPPFSNNDYWAFADWIQPVFDAVWNPQAVSYNNDPRVNAGMLLTHSIAAYAGHQGPTRNDARAQALALRLCQSPPYRPLSPGQSPGSTSPKSASQAHRPGYTASMTNANGTQHISIDPKICEGLYFAWVARNQLGLPASTVSLIQERIHSVSHSKFNLYPNIRLNQINWTAELYEYEYLVNGDSSLLKNDYREQIQRWTKGALKPTSPWKITNTSQSYSFHRDPFQALTTPQNVESNEYALIMLDFIKRYETAIQAGMKPITGRSFDTVKAFVTRALSAYWTHAGFLNWDTGLYLQRWMLGRYWAWSVQGLSAIASSNTFASADERSWAKYIFDQSMSLYVRKAIEAGPGQVIPASPMYFAPTTFGLAPFDFAVRFQWHAATAVYRNLASQPAAQPPPLYAYDPPIGRLAITTPTYNTAIMGVNNKAFPYGGIEMARLYDSQQRVVANIGGQPPAGFGIIVRNSSGKAVASSQVPKSAPSNTDPPIHLTKSPHGRIGAGVPYPKSPYAGAFSEIGESGTVSKGGIQITSNHIFRSASIDVSWGIKRKKGGELSADALFPTWNSSVGIVAVKTNGQQVPITTNPIPLTGVAYFYLQSQQTGYLVVPVSGGSAATARTTQPSYQTSNPKPGPSLAIRIVQASSWKSTSFAVRIAPANGLVQAAQIAKTLQS